jgi:antitoxin HicB
MLEFQAKLTPESDGFVVTFPDFAWGVTQGDTELNALEMAAEVIELVLEDCIARGLPLPAQRKRTGKVYRTIQLPVMVAAKAGLYSAFLDSKLTKSELARRLGIPRTNVDRLFNLHHNTRLDQLEAAFAAVGKSLAISVVTRRATRREAA